MGILPFKNDKKVLMFQRNFTASFKIKVISTLKEKGKSKF
jgi:hypothetical protein